MPDRMGASHCQPHRGAAVPPASDVTPIIAVDLIARHPAAGTAAAKARASIAWASSPLVAKRTSGGTPTFLAAASSAQLLSRYSARSRKACLGTGIGQEDPDLAVLDPPRRPRILPRHPDGFGPLLQEARLVGDQHRLRIAQVLDDVGTQVITHRLRIPASGAQQPLHTVGIPFA